MIAQPLTHRSSFPGTIQGAVDAAQWLRDAATAESLPDKIVFGLEVCLEELVTNIVRHGGPMLWEGSMIAPDMGALTIAVTLNSGPEAVELVVEDNGKSFNVAGAPARPIDGALEDVIPGGLGIQLVRSFSDELVYEPLTGGNRAIVKFLRQSEGRSKAAV